MYLYINTSSHTKTIFFRRRIEKGNRKSVCYFVFIIFHESLDKNSMIK